MQVKISNKTNYSYIGISQTIRACIRKVSETEEKPNIILRVFVKYSRCHHYRGIANSHRCYIVIRLPRGEYERHKLAILFLHEYGHILGIPHSKRRALEGWVTGTIEHLYKEWICDEFGVNL